MKNSKCNSAVSKCHFCTFECLMKYNRIVSQENESKFELY